MTRSRFNDPIEPMTLQNMRENGVRSLFVSCWQCHHRAILNVDHLPGDLTVPRAAHDVHQMRDDRRRCQAEWPIGGNVGEVAGLRLEAREAFDLTGGWVVGVW